MSTHNTKPTAAPPASTLAHTANVLHGAIYGFEHTQIFQLLLPEFSSSTHDPLIVLIVLCAIAPFWAWGANMVVHRDPERQNATAR